MTQISALKKELDSVMTQLLHPISKQSPSGENLKYDPVFDDIKKARLHNDPSEPRGTWDRELKSANWMLVRQLCEETLSTRSKDLQVVGWLMEAYIHIYGLEGLTQGLQLLYDLNRTNWATVYPQAKNDDWEYRTRVYDWVNQKIPYALQSVNLTDAHVEGKKEIKFIDLIRLHKRTSALQTQISNEFLEQIEATDTSFFKDSLAQLEKCRKILAQLELFLQTNLKSTTIYFYGISGNITTLIDWYRECLEHKQSMGKSKIKKTPLELKSDHETPEPRILPNAAKFTTRDEAYNMLGKIIHYLSETEPSSPIPYILYKGYELRNANLGETMKIFSESGVDAFKLMEFFGMEKAISQGETSSKKNNPKNNKDSSE